MENKVGRNSEDIGVSREFMNKNQTAQEIFAESNTGIPFH